MARGPSVVDYLQAGLNAADLRGKVTSNNIANMETPGFHRSSVRFEQLLAKAMSGGKEADLSAVTPQIVQPQDVPPDERGNNVSMDVELGDLIKNGLQTRVYIRTLAKVYSQIDMAIADHV
jgi:flagellar basal-body rod protein FlgB